MEQQFALCEAFTNKDMEVFFSIPNLKSPGPDGLSSSFFKKAWGKIGPLICKAIQNFFSTGILPRKVCDTKLILLPKIQHPQTVNDFRPISCCNVIYKGITKLLCKRLKEVLPDLINESQGAFVKGREILYNVLICQDLARGYQRKHISPRCILKIDLKKAFDSIHWPFIWRMLEALKFPNPFIHWIKECVTNVSFNLHLNGQDHGWFKGGRGLKQGDPLSPLLFVITMEYLSRTLQQSSKKKDFKFHPGCRALKLTHLMFADDLLLFCKADPATLQEIMNALHHFHEVTGLQVNMAKSQMVLGGCSENLKKKCTEISGFQDSHFPLKYLGVPLTASRLTKAECEELIARIRAKVQVWITRNLSFAARARLINTIIFGMYSYWASIFLLPNEIITKLTQISRNFLWSASEEHKRPPHISWYNTCLPKNQGGLGLKDYGCWNKALTAKLVWDVATKKDKLWVKWIHEKYIKGRAWGDYYPPNDSGWHWKKLCYIKELFKEGNHPQNSWQWQGKPKYSVRSGYRWLMGDQSKQKWTRIPWARPVIPRQAFILWLALNHRLPTKVYLNRHIQQQDMVCALCKEKEEDDQHLFLTCAYAKEIWTGIKRKWDMPMQGDWSSLSKKLLSIKCKAKSHITYAYFAAGIYFIWRARNSTIFQQNMWPSTKVIGEILYQIRTRILYLHSINGKYSAYIDYIV